MKRKEQLERLHRDKEYDMIIIGGGATGLGCAVDAASRGFKTLLLEKYDFAKGTSSRATKLVHGGVRYLAQGNIRLVREALLERGRLLKNAPHVCHTLSFVVPFYKWWQKFYYGIGLRVYELLSGELSLGKTKLLSKKEALQMLPDLSANNLTGAVLYFDGQFDDSRLAVNLAQTAIEHGATVINYCGVTGFTKDKVTITGVKAKDEISGNRFEIKAKVVINATGVFADELFQMAEGHLKKTISPSQGTHLVVDNCFFRGTTAMMIPKTDDGRILFAIPWHDKLLLGTTDIPVKHISTEPKPMPEEIDFIISHFNRFAVSKITHSDVRAVFAGLRPLANADDEKKTALMPRDHTVKVLPSGLIHVTGGKWTTYRSMAENVIDKAIHTAGLKFISCKTKQVQVHGWVENKNDDYLSVYGSDAIEIRQMMQTDDSLSEKVHPLYPFVMAQVKWAIEHEMAVNIEDVLARRIRLLFLDAEAAIEAAPAVVKKMASVNGRDVQWEMKQVETFNTLAKGYLLN